MDKNYLAQLIAAFPAQVIEVEGEKLYYLPPARWMYGALDEPAPPAGKPNCVSVADGARFGGKLVFPAGVDLSMPRKVAQDAGLAKWPNLTKASFDAPFKSNDEPNKEGNVPSEKYPDTYEKGGFSLTIQSQFPLSIVGPDGATPIAPNSNLLYDGMWVIACVGEPYLFSVGMGCRFGARGIMKLADDDKIQAGGNANVVAGFKANPFANAAASTPGTVAKTPPANGADLW